MSTTLPSLTQLSPLQDYNQQNIGALQDAYNSYSTAAQNGIAGAQQKADAAKAALATYGALPTLPGTASATQTGTAPANTGSGPFSAIAGAVNHVLGTSSADASLGMISQSAYARATVFIMGVILFAAGLFAFKSTQTVIETATDTTRKVAAL